MWRLIRQRYHPLWRLRQNSLFRRIQHLVDPDVSCRIGDVRASIKLLRDASVLVGGSCNESKSVQVFTKLLLDQKIDLFFDIGANIGLYSWIAKAHKVEDVLLFEPDETNQRLLRKTIRRNSLQGCFLWPLAVSSEFGISDFLLDPVSGATGSLVDHSQNPASLHAAYKLKSSIKVPTINLDAFTDYARSRSVAIKIDVEGAEDAVFRGAKRFIQSVRPYILVEAFDASILAPLEKAGYQITAMEENFNYTLCPREKQQDECAIG